MKKKNLKDLKKKKKATHVIRSRQKVLHYMLQLNTVHVNVTVSCMIKLYVERHGKGITLHVTIEHCAC